MNVGQHQPCPAVLGRMSQQSFQSFGGLFCVSVVRIHERRGEQRRVAVRLELLLQLISPLLALVAKRVRR
jgi:hypothetical protein